MQNIILALGVTITVLAISAVKSPKLKAAIYSLPIPISIILLGTGGDINITHIVGLVLVLIFFIGTFILHKLIKVPIILAIILSTLIYILLGLLNRFIVDVPFLYGYIIFLVIWGLYILKPLKIKRDKYDPITSSMRPVDYLIRGGIIFAIANLVIGIKGLIFGAAVTFPFNGIFTAYVVRDHLPVFITELFRNFFGISTFFLMVWLLEDKIGLLAAIGIGWIVCGAIIYFISARLPRKYSEVV
jgi:hypothetical protein